MPIKNLTEIYRPVRQGKIHLGVKKKTDEGVEYPSEVNFFVLKGCPELFEFYGPDPEKIENPENIHQELHISLPSARFDKNFDQYLDKVFPQYLKRYRGGAGGVLHCKGDGEVATCWDEKEGGMKEIPCPCDYLEKKECQKIGIFRFRIREIPSFNVYQITTSSFNSLVNLNSFIRDLLEHCAVFDIDPSAVKLILRRNEQVVQRIDNGKPKSSRHHILELDLDSKFYKSLDELRGLAKLPPSGEPEKLPPPDENKDELFFPKKELKPEETEKKKEWYEEKPKEGSEDSEEQDQVKQEVLEDIDKARNEYNDIMFAYQKKGGKVTEKEKKRLLELKGFSDFSGAITFYRAKLEELEKEQKKTQDQEPSEDEAPFPDEPGAQKK